MNVSRTRGGTAEAIARGRKYVERRLMAMEDWLAEIQSSYPWPALEQSVKLDIAELQQAAGIEPVGVPRARRRR